jgi:hypothetical protein
MVRNEKQYHMISVMSETTTNNKVNSYRDFNDVL